MTQKWLIAAAAIIVVAGGLWLVLSNRAAAPSSEQGNGDLNATTTASTTPVTSSSTQTQAPSNNPVSGSFVVSLVTGDTIKSWDFTGAYNSNSQLQAKAQTEITRLKGTVGSNGVTNYDIYISIANQYDLLGNGKQELTYLEKALSIDSTHTGLAWSNVGQLMAKLGAIKTARQALERSVAVEPTKQSHQALLDFLKIYYPTDSAAVAKEQAAVNASSN